MRIRTSLQGPEIDAYIVSSFDEHQSQQIDDAEKRLEFISGFSGPIGDTVVKYLFVLFILFFIFVFNRGVVSRGRVREGK